MLVVWKIVESRRNPPVRGSAACCRVLTTMESGTKQTIGQEMRTTTSASCSCCSTSTAQRLERKRRGHPSSRSCCNASTVPPTFDRIEEKRGAGSRGHPGEHPRVKRWWGHIIPVHRTEKALVAGARASAPSGERLKGGGIGNRGVHSRIGRNAPIRTSAFDPSRITAISIPECSPWKADRSQRVGCGRRWRHADGSVQCRMTLP